jgi:hypothetical protein
MYKNLSKTISGFPEDSGILFGEFGQSTKIFKIFFYPHRPAQELRFRDFFAGEKFGEKFQWPRHAFSMDRILGKLRKKWPQRFAKRITAKDRNGPHARIIPSENGQGRE